MISAGKTPATQLLSKRPSILSMIRIEEVRATAKKKTMLQEKYVSKYLLSHFFEYYIDYIIDII